MSDLHPSWLMAHGFSREQAYAILQKYGPSAVHIAVEAIQDHGFTADAAFEAIDKHGPEVLDAIFDGLDHVAHNKSALPDRIANILKDHPEAYQLFVHYAKEYLPVVEAEVKEHWPEIETEAKSIFKRAWQCLARLWSRFVQFLRRRRSPKA